MSVVWHLEMSRLDSISYLQFVTSATIPYYRHNNLQFTPTYNVLQLPTIWYMADNLIF